MSAPHPLTQQIDVRELAGEIATLLAERQPLAPLLTADEAAALLSVPASWVLSEARTNRIPSVRLGRYVRFKRDDLEQWLERRAS